MLMFRHLAPAAAAVALLGCGPSGDPALVAQAFWEAQAAGNIPGAEEFVTKRSKGALGYQANDGFTIADFTLGELRVDGEDAFVATHLAAERNGTPAEISFETTLVVEDKTWKVNVDATFNALRVSTMPEGDPAAQFRAQRAGGPNNSMERVMQQMDDPKARESLRRAMRNAPSTRR